MKRSGHQHEHEGCPACEQMEQRVVSQEMLIRQLSQDIGTLRDAMAGRFGATAAETIFTLMENHNVMVGRQAERIQELHSDLNDLYELNHQLREQIHEYQKIHP